MHSPRHRKKGTVHATKKLGEGRNRFSPGSLKKTTTTTTKAQAAEVHNNMQVRNTGYRMYCCNVQRWEWKAFAFLHTTHRSTILFFVWAFSFKKASPVQLCTLHVHNRRHPKMKTGIKGGGGSNNTNFIWITTNTYPYKPPMKRMLTSAASGVCFCLGMPSAVWSENVPFLSCCEILHLVFTFRRGLWI